jgi:hypothetical protein
MIPGRRPHALSIVAAAFLSLVATRALHAQDLWISGAPVAFPEPAVSDYDAGYVYDPGLVTFTVRHPSGTNRWICIRAVSDLGGGKPVAHLEWQRTDVGVWNPMDVGWNRVALATNSSGFTVWWSRDLRFRVRLDWTEDPPQLHETDIRIVVVTFSGVC